MRYYWKTGTTDNATHGTGNADSATQARIMVNLPVEMRAKPTVTKNNLYLSDGANTSLNVNISGTTFWNKLCIMLLVTTTGANIVAFRPYYLSNLSNGFLMFDAEL